MVKIDNLKNRKYFLKYSVGIEQLFMGFYIQKNTDEIFWAYCFFI